MLLMMHAIQEKVIPQPKIEEREIKLMEHWPAEQFKIH